MLYHLSYGPRQNAPGKGRILPAEPAGLEPATMYSQRHSRHCSRHNDKVEMKHVSVLCQLSYRPALSDNGAGGIRTRIPGCVSM